MSVGFALGNCKSKNRHSANPSYNPFPEDGFTMYAVFMRDGLLQQKTKLLKDNEHFCGQGVRKSLRLLDYWRWSGPEL